MGRSVSYASGSTAIAYQMPELTYTDDEGNIIYDIPDLWDDYKEDIRFQIKTIFPSMKLCDTWLGREDLAIMENSHAFIGVSEYCGMVSIWLKPKFHYDYSDSTRHNNAASFWCNQVKQKFLSTFSQYVKVGTMSNGAALYREKTKC